MKRIFLLIAAFALLAALLCGCEKDHGAAHTAPPRVTGSVTASPRPTAVPTATAAPTEAPETGAPETDGGAELPGETGSPDVSEAPEGTPQARHGTLQPGLPGGWM